MRDAQLLNDREMNSVLRERWETEKGRKREFEKVRKYLWREQSKIG